MMRLRRADTELVAVGVGEHGPGVPGDLVFFEGAGAEVDQAVDLADPVAVAGEQVEVETVLAESRLGDLLQAERERAVAPQDQILTAEIMDDPQVERLLPEASQGPGHGTV